MSDETLKNALCKNPSYAEKVKKITRMRKKLQTLCDSEESKTLSESEFNVDLNRQKVTEKLDNMLAHSSSANSDTNKVMDVKVQKNRNQHQKKDKINCIYSTQVDSSDSTKSIEDLQQNNTSHQNLNDDSSDSFLSFINKQKKQRIPVNKRIYKRQKNGGKFVRNSQIIDYESSDSEFDGKNLSITNLGTVKNQQERKHQHSPVNFKSFIVEITKHLIRLFSRFQCRINKFQQSYIQGEVIRKLDAKNIIFLLNCIISNLKEKLTEEQQDITKSYIHYKRNLNSSNARRNQTKCKRDSNVLSETEISSSNDSGETEEISSGKIYRQVPLKVTKSPGQSVLPKNDNTVLQASSKSDSNEKLSKMNNVRSANNENKVKIRRIENVSPILSTFKDLRRFQHMEKSTKKKDTEPYIKVSDEERFNPFSLSPKRMQETQNSKSTDQLPDYDSDVNSTCSTVTLFQTTKNKNKNQNDKPIYKAVDNNPEVTILSESTFVKPNSPSKNQAYPLSYDSDDTIILDNVTTRKTRISKDTYETNVQENEALTKSHCKNSITTHQFLAPETIKMRSNNCVKRNHDTEHINSQCSTAKKKKNEFKMQYFNSDKKLQMLCNVTLEPLKIQLS